VGFTCAVCGEYHEELLLDIRMGLPEPVFELSQQERAARAAFSDDAGFLCEPDGSVRFFVRGLLQIPIPELDRHFAYGTWVEVEREDYERLGELWSDPAGEGREFRCSLANELEPYRGTVGLAGVLRLRSVDLLPAVELERSDHSLAAEQASGIRRERAEALASAVPH
jgi:hypothetical protein